MTIEPITVKKLIEELKKCPQEALVFCASDSEENEISPFGCIQGGKVGTEYKMPNGKVYYVDGKNFEYFDFEKNKGKRFIVIAPSL